jgi:hypothetical protein
LKPELPFKKKNLNFFFQTDKDGRPANQQEKTETESGHLELGFQGSQISNL